MRDFGFYIYKTLYTLPEKAEEVKDDKSSEKGEKKDDKKDGDKKEEKKDDKRDEKSDKRDDRRDGRRRDRRVSTDFFLQYYSFGVNKVCFLKPSRACQWDKIMAIILT